MTGPVTEFWTRRGHGKRRLRQHGQFILGLKRYLSDSLDLEQSLAICRDHQSKRKLNFLRMARDCIYAFEGSPYLWLLQSAGCEFGDLEKLVSDEGLDTALGHLAADGVYFSIDEFKGKKEVRRGSQSCRFSDRDFDNPQVTGQLEAHSGASRGKGTRMAYTLDFFAQSWAPHQVLRTAADGCLGAPLGIWLPIRPGAGPVSLLTYAKGGIYADKWYSPVSSSGFRPSLVNRLTTRYIVHASRLFGARIPTPEFVALEDAAQIAHWMAQALREQGRCFLATYVSAAARVSTAAVKLGLDLSGAVFTVSSEPFTPTKKAEIEKSGASVFPMFAFMECGVVGLGCHNPSRPDDYHFLDDTSALVLGARQSGGVNSESDALMFTSLLSSAPKILLNVQTGDRGEIEKRSCGCVVEEWGFGTHLHTVSSFEKTSGEGMSFLGCDLQRIVEEVLPEAFGGATTDYQFIEEEEAGRTRLTIAVSPSIGAVDEPAIISRVVNELARGGDSNRMMAQLWSQAGTVRVRRMEPVPTARGKLLPLHLSSGGGER